MKEQIPGIMGYKMPTLILMCILLILNIENSDFSPNGIAFALGKAVIDFLLGLCFSFLVPVKIRPSKIYQINWALAISLIVAVVLNAIH